MPIEDRESYAAALKRYLERDFQHCLARDNFQLLQDRNGRPLHDRDVDEIRSFARDNVNKINAGGDLEFIRDEYDPEHPGNVADFPFLTIARDVITEKAVVYFQQLMAYLRAREISDPEINEIRRYVTDGTNVLLRELREVIPNFSASERTADNAKFVRADLRLVLDSDRIRREAGLTNLFRISDVHHFGDSHGDPSLGELSNPYSGMRVEDILFFLNGDRDVDLGAAIIRADGTVDIAEAPKPRMRLGLDMTLDKVPEAAQAHLADRIVFSTRAEKFDDIALTKEILANNGLLPAWRITFGDTTVYLPNILYVKNAEGRKDRVRTVIYIEDEKKGLIVRSCYKSLSHAMWKLLPAHRHSWHHKGQGEEQITLPPELQRAISYLCSIEEIREADVVFFGTTGEAYGQITGSFQEEVVGKPTFLGEGFYAKTRQGKVDPESPSSFQFADEGDKPNFSAIVDSWEELTNFYGAVTFEIFESRNGRLQYVICRDKKGRAWIAAVDIKAEKMTSHGVKANWIFAGDLCTPALEYREQAGIYARNQFGQYVDMFTPYTSRIPLMQEYLSSVAARTVSI